jgi:hypothetical protein
MRMKQIGWWLMSIALVACGQQASDSPSEMARAAAPMTKMAADSMLGGAEQSMTELSEPTATNPEVKKYIALRHHLNVELAAEQLQAGFDAALKHCEALSCQILSANFNKETQYNPPSASLSVRLPPRNVEVFLGGLAKSGEIIQHTREAEDKTNQVVDAEARIQNLTELRDRLRQMLGDKSAKFKDIIDVERELANTQSQLDSIMSLRKALRLETDLVAVNIHFSARQGITEQGFFSPVARAIKDAGRVMMESLASLITLVMSALPWVVIGIPLIVLVIKLWKKLKAK